MDIQNYTTEHRKGQHLLAEERHEIEVRLKDGWSPYRIAKHLGRAYNTIKNEIARGTVYLYNGKVARYKAKAGEQQYKDNRRNSRRQYKRLAVSSFINYVDNGLIGIKNIDLPEKLKRNTKKEKVRKHKRVLGDSIELRPESVELREEFGHWEVDTVLGSKYEDEPCTVTMTERKTRNSIWIKAANHTADAVQEAIQSIMDYFGIKASTVFKSVTGDNGSEFARLAELASQGTSVYFTHPYSSWEKGTNECHNRLLRRFIPKGVSMAGYSAEDIAYMADWANTLPRKILGYRTPEELFDEELDRIYAI